MLRSARMITAALLVAVFAVLAVPLGFAAVPMVVRALEEPEPTRVPSTPEIQLPPTELTPPAVVSAREAEAPTPDPELLAAALDAELILETIDAGAAGYIPKATDTALTIQALRVVLAHGVFVPGHALRSAAPLQPAAAAARPPELSPKQRLVLDRLLQGKSNKVIAAVLNLSIKTVETHRSAAMHKVGAKSAADLTLYAARNDLVQL